MNLIFLGAPGAGKGTYSAKLTEKCNIPHISTGDIFRLNIKNDTELGRKAKSYMDKGQLVPDDVVIEIVEDRLNQDDCKKGYALDGFPRTIPQAVALDRVAKIDKIINLKITDEEIIRRLAGRRACSCGNTSHVDWLKDGITCDKCGALMYQREDDKEETIKKRLEVYKEQTAPLIDYYQDQGKLLNIDSIGGVDNVMDNIYKALNIE